MQENVSSIGLNIEISIFNCFKENNQLITLYNYLDNIKKVLLKKFPLENIETINNMIELYAYKRSYETYTFEHFNDKEKVEFLSTIPQPEQRSEEWYLFRENHITASDAYKIFGTQSKKNEIIYSKCNKKKKDISENVIQENPMTWGVKYEPLTSLIYELKNNTKISEYGCIPHPTYLFLAASPDGIVTGNYNYGRMIEIKNVFSRIINGIPKTEYYIQMQLQLEVCDLEECDFVETKFVEYENESSYIHDKETKYKGVIVTFIKNNQFVYKYMPFDCNDYEKWIDNTIYETTKDQSIIWCKNCYWKLDVYSCVLVKRNKKWFQHSIQEIEDIWKLILKEREDGSYVLRKSNINKKKQETETKPNCNVKIF